MTKNEKVIEVLRLNTDSMPYAEEIDNELKVFQKIVGGNIEVITLEIQTPDGPTDICCVLNEEGKLIELEPNFAFPLGQGYWDVVVGDVFFCGDYYGEEGKEFRSLTDDEFMGVLGFLQTGKKALFAILEQHLKKEGSN